jgi:enoyl-CoA hydratase/carnithine racemase
MTDVAKNELGTGVQSRQEPRTVLADLTPEGVLLITLNRPDQLNALTGESESLLIKTLLDAAQDDRVKVIVLTGAGRGFCSGADMKYLVALSNGLPRPQKLRPYWFITELPKPVIAAINGACVGGGFVLAMMCDMRFASATAKVGAAFPRLGLPAENGVAWLLPRIIGYARAYEVMGGGLLYSGEDLARLGLVNAVVPAEDLLAHTMRIASDMALNCSPRSMALIKAQMHAGFASDIKEADALASRLVDGSHACGDVKESLRARAEGGPPRFKQLGKDPVLW